MKGEADIKSDVVLETDGSVKSELTLLAPKDFQSGGRSNQFCADYH